MGKKIITSNLRSYEETEQNRNRIETRRISVVSVKEGQDGWQGCRQWCRIERRRELRHYCSIETVYAITSLSEDQVDAKTLLHLNRRHWGVEVIHRIKDVLLQEDASTIRKGNAPFAMAMIRSFKLYFIKKVVKMKPKEGHEFLTNNIKYIRKVTDW
jgi:predicted transposase YbfD/YdcC